MLIHKTSINKQLTHVELEFEPRAIGFLGRSLIHLFATPKVLELKVEINT